MQKSDEWIYEQEYRVILRLEQADRVIIPSLNLIDNEKIKAKIENSIFSTVDSHGKYTINLCEIDDEAERIGLAMKLAKLSQNSQVIYLMKLDASSINNCLLGLNCSLTKKEVSGEYAIKTGYLNVWKAQKNLDYYSIEFEEIT